MSFRKFGKPWKPAASKRSKLPLLRPVGDEALSLRLGQGGKGAATNGCGIADVSADGEGGSYQHGERAQIDVHAATSFLGFRASGVGKSVVAISTPRSSARDKRGACLHSGIKFTGRHELTVVGERRRASATATVPPSASMI